MTHLKSKRKILQLLESFHSITAKNKGQETSVLTKERSQCLDAYSDAVDKFSQAQEYRNNIDASKVDYRSLDEIHLRYVNYLERQQHQASARLAGVEERLLASRQAAAEQLLKKKILGAKIVELENADKIQEQKIMADEISYCNGGLK